MEGFLATHNFPESDERFLRSRELAATENGACVEQKDFFHPSPAGTSPVSSIAFETFN